jgi:phenylacetate-coenzyme A ligase PaaK-like adenylate-forming protein
VFEPAAEGMSTDERATLQRGALRGLVDRLLAKDGVQGRRLKDAGIEAAADVDDLAALPTTAKRDLWDAYPFGLLSVPREEVVAVHGSSGTGGRPTLVGYTRADLELWSRMCARSLAAAGATAESTIQNAYGYGLFTGGVGIHQGGIALGATVLPMSAGQTERQLTMLRDLKPDILTCTPSYAVYLGEAARSADMELSLKAGVFGAEPWSEALRRQIEDLLGIKACDIYGLSEIIGPGVASECIEAQDGLHVNEDHFLVETLDPVTGKPTEDGVPGELTFTTPTKEALPLLRYRTGDIASLNRAPCVCGRTLVRMSKVTGRVDDMVVIRGVNVYPSEVEAVLLAQPGIAPHYLLVVDRRTPTARLLVACEGPTGPQVPAARDALGDTLRQRLGISAEVVVLPAGTVPRVEAGKAKRRVDWADGPAPLPGLETA